MTPLGRIMAADLLKGSVSRDAETKKSHRASAVRKPWDTVCSYHSDSQENRFNEPALRQ